QNLQKAKRLFREAVAVVDQLDLGLRKQVWTNYGNCLDQLGRVMEALYAYDEALLIDSRFPMALGNKAVAVLFFADVSGAHREAMYIKAYQMLKSVLENKDLVRFGGIAAKDSFENVSKRIEELFRDKSVLSISLEHPRYDVAHMTAFERFYTDFCSTYRLFLNFHIHEDECEASVVDPVFISLITPINDNETYYDLAKHINQIKEDYGVARLLLAQSQFRREDLDRISKRTTFVNALDYSVFNIYVGLLKSAFKEAYNILDKIAVFINEYFRIGLKQENVQFYSKIDRRCIWREKGEVREKILLSRNISLYALYDIYLDFDSGYYKKLQDIRNALVHRRLVVYDSLLADRGKTDDIQNIGYETMLSEAIRLLQLVKSSIIYLINFVQLEEEKKRDPTDLIPPMYVDTTQFL
ncbi:MAG: LA2681 family HEPN domain-containing protein, partial [Promethearchaeota archaeon]